MRIVIWPEPGYEGSLRYFAEVENGWEKLSRELRRQLNAAGYEVVVHPDCEVDVERDIGLYFEHAPIRELCKRSLCIFMEPPVVRAYQHEHIRGLPYDRTLTFDLDQCDDKKIFYLPIGIPSYNKDISHINRDKYMVAIYSNKTSDHPRQLYTARQDILRGLGPYIDVFGHGWEGVPGINYKGLVTDKIAKMAEYKYALYTENCDIRGYNTEKLYHAIQAGCSPHPWVGNRVGVLPLDKVTEKPWAETIVRHIREIT
jgi:hypothetical protein